MNRRGFFVTVAGAFLADRWKDVISFHSETRPETQVWHVEAYKVPSVRFVINDGANRTLTSAQYTGGPVWFAWESDITRLHVWDDDNRRYRLVTK